MAHNAQQRQDHGQQNARFHARPNHRQSSHQRHRKLAGALAPDAQHSADVDQMKRNQEHQSAEHALGKECQRPDEEQQHAGLPRKPW